MTGNARATISDLFSAKRVRIGWFSSWNTRCGIAEHSRFLLDAFDAEDLDVTILASVDDVLLGPDEDRVVRCWTNLTGVASPLLREVERRAFDVLFVQFNFGFLSLRHLDALIACCHSVGTPIVILFHATADKEIDGRLVSLQQVARALAAADQILVHSAADQERLRAIGIADNVELFPHGVLDNPVVARAAARAALGLDEKAIVIGSYGFLVPLKGIDVLIDALPLLRAAGQPAKLLLVNALYPLPLSEQLLLRCREKAAELGVVEEVIFETGYLSYQDSLAKLAACDLIVFPYQESSESSSAAVRIGLAARRPVLCSPLGIFNDVAEVVRFLPGCSAEDIRDGVLATLADPEGCQELVRRQDDWLAAHAWGKVGQHLKDILVKSASRGADMQRTASVTGYISALVAEREQSDWMKPQMERMHLELQTLRQVVEQLNGQLSEANARIGDLERLGNRLRDDAERSRDDAERSRGEAEAKGRQLEEVYGSTSWALTAPLRHASRLARRLVGGS